MDKDKNTFDTIGGLMSFEETQQQLKHIASLIADMPEKEIKNNIGYEQALRLRISSIIALADLLTKYINQEK